MSLKSWALIQRSNGCTIPKLNFESPFIAVHFRNTYLFHVSSTSNTWWWHCTELQKKRTTSDLTNTVQVSYDLLRLSSPFANSCDRQQRNGAPSWPLRRLGRNESSLNKRKNQRNSTQTCETIYNCGAVAGVDVVSSPDPPHHAPSENCL